MGIQSFCTIFAVYEIEMPPPVQWDELLQVQFSLSFVLGSTLNKLRVSPAHWRQMPNSGPPSWWPLSKKGVVEGLVPRFELDTPRVNSEAPIGLIKDKHYRRYLMTPASAQVRVRPERKDGGYPALCNAPPQWLRMRHQSHQSHQRSVRF